MGDLTKTNLTDEIKAGLGRKNVSGDDISPAEYVRALNLAQSRLTQLHTWKALDRLVTGSVVITGVPATDRFFDPTPFIGTDGVEDILAFRYNDAPNSFYRKLIRWPMRQFNRIIDQPLFTGTPFIYAFPASLAGKEDNLILWYVPNINYNFEFRYMKKPTLFTTSADIVSDFEHSLDEALIAFGTYYLMQRTTRKDDAAIFFQSFNSIVEQAIAADISAVDTSLMNRGASESTGGVSDYWRDPFVRGNP